MPTESIARKQPKSRGAKFKRNKSKAPAKPETEDKDEVKANLAATAEGSLGGDSEAGPAESRSMLGGGSEDEGEIKPATAEEQSGLASQAAGDSSGGEEVADALDPDAEDAAEPPMAPPSLDPAQAVPTPTGPCFMVSFTGQIETAELPFHDYLYCKMSFVSGHEWSITSGLEEGCTQCAKKSADGRHIFVWNFPIDITFKSYQPFGWPRIVLAVYGQDGWGRDVVRGYGSHVLPLTPGMHTQQIGLFVPETSSFIQRALGWVVGRRAEYVDSKFVAQAAGREATRVSSQGKVTLRLNMIMKDFARYGYNSGPVRR